MAENKSSGGGWAVLAVLLAIGYCSIRDDKPKAVTSATSVSEADESETDDTREAVSDSGDVEDGGQLIAGETYTEYDRRRDSLSTGTYSGGYECTEDCSGHDAGRRWAEQRGITSADDCGGRSWSFVEGCRSYAEEQTSSQEAVESEGEGEDEL